MRSTGCTFRTRLRWHNLTTVHSVVHRYPVRSMPKYQTGQQLLLGAYSALSRQVQKVLLNFTLVTKCLDLVVIEGRARGIIARNLVTGEIERFAAHAVVIGTGGYGNAFFLSTNAMGSNGSVAIQCYKKGAYFANPCFASDSPDLYPRTR